jgi:hypothetical protein
MTPTKPLSSVSLFDEKDCALYPSFFAASLTRSFVLLEILAPLVKHLDTADCDTPANFATSREVAIFLVFFILSPFNYSIS